jgi:isopentenyl-diphosphate delta-isomerase
MTQLIPTWVDGRLRPIEKLRAHQLGLRHKAVSVFVIRGDEILLQRRALAKYHSGGLWANTCCTHPAWGERPMDCAIRRLTEELGIRGTALEWRQRLEYRADVGDGLIEHERVDLFVARVETLEITPNPDEVMETKWIALQDLTKAIEHRPETFTAWLRIYMRDHVSQIFAAPIQSAHPS